MNQNDPKASLVVATSSNKLLSMPSSKKPERHVIDIASLDANSATQLQTADFWEKLGKTVATFGALEQTLMQAAFAFT